MTIDNKNGDMDVDQEDKSKEGDMNGKIGESNGAVSRYNTSLYQQGFGVTAEANRLMTSDGYKYNVELACIVSSVIYYLAENLFEIYAVFSLF